MQIIRWILGSIILTLDFIFTPKARVRNDQTQVNVEADKLKLYQFKSCPFCVKVRRAMKRLNLPIETRDARRQGPVREELIAKGGKAKVPCLRIENADGTFQWMYESSDIIAYLQKRFA